MDAQTTSVAQNPLESQQKLPLGNFFDKFKNLPKKQKLLIGGLVVVLITILASLFLYLKPTVNESAVIIAKVGDVALPQSYLDMELQYYPGTPSAEIKKAVANKLVDDQITLESAKKEGVIADYPGSIAVSKEEYLKRTDLVKSVQQKINDKGNIIKGKTVMVWFYNNRHIGPGGIEESKKFAYSKIKPLYDRVKSGEITIEQAGQTIKADKSITAIDPVYESNALNPFVYYKNKTATFWPEYNELLWNTKPKELTPLYLGGGILREGKPVEELYIFSQVDQKSTNASYNDFREWLEQKRREYKIEYSSLPFFQRLNPVIVLANEDAGSQDVGGDSQGGGNEGNSSNGSGGGGGDNPDNGSRSGVWYGKVTTPTGLPVAGAQVNILTGCNQPNGRTETTGAGGNYLTPTDYNLSCLCNPETGTASYNGSVCEKKVVTIGNGDASIEVNFQCNLPPSSPTPTPSPTPPPPPPSPTPTPPPACNKPCTTPRDCAGNLEGCLQCRPNSQSQNTCQPPPPPACNAFCSSSRDCDGNKEGCVECVAGQCRIPPACNVGCTKDEQCAGARDGCKVCLPSDSGTGKVCRPTPACNVACTKDGQCAGARDGCTACVGGVCKIPPACGVACTTRADCSGAKDGCVECLEGTCTDYNDNMCKCDGIVAEMDYPNNFKFEAFGKVDGANAKKAEIADITFRMTRDNQVVAKSNPITPQIVENNASKIRFKASWNTPPPAISRGSTYRVFADVRCKPKKIIASAKENFTPNPEAVVKVPQPKPPLGLKLVLDLVDKLLNSRDWVGRAFVGEVMAQLSSPSPSGAQSNLQLQTLKFVKLMDTDNCRFVMFKFDETLF